MDKDDESIKEEVMQYLDTIKNINVDNGKSAIAGLQKGELIIKDHTMAALSLGGKPYKKIKVTHLI